MASKGWHIVQQTMRIHGIAKIRFMTFRDSESYAF
jgi:hypothetical protein